MPNIITHTLFANDISVRVDDSIKSWLKPRMHLFQIGSNGPDFLFFHGMDPKKFYFKSDLRSAGSRFHAGNVNDFYQSALTSIRNEENEEVKWDMIAYMCGHLCHWALDSTSHPYIFYRTGTCKGKSAWYHHRFESVLDALLLEVKKECTIEDFKFYEISDASLEEARAIARVYVPAIRNIFGYDVQGHHILESLNAWCFMEKVFYDPNSKKIDLLKHIEKVTHTENFLSGYIVPSDVEDEYDVLNLKHNRWVHPSDSNFVSTESFFDLYDRALLLAQEAIRVFLACVDNPDNDSDLMLVLQDRNYDLGKSDREPMVNFDLIF